MVELCSELKKLAVPFGITLNVVSSISIIQINKFIYVHYNFPNMTLTCLHFVITFIGLLICYHLNVFKHVKVPILKMVPMAATFCGFVVLTNLSLQMNAIGTYQCLKIMTIPGCMIISMLYYKHTYSMRVKLSVAPALLGIFFNSMYDLSFNIDGLIMGLVGAAVTSLYLVWIGEKQKEFKMNALQLLVYQAPLSSIMLFFIIPFFEPMSGNLALFDSKRELVEWFFIILSGINAFVINLSTYWVIGNTSALTYNMLGNLKFIATIIIGHVIFKESFSGQQIAAVFTVLVGITLYTYFKIKEAEDKKSLLSLLSTSSLSESKS